MARKINQKDIPESLVDEWVQEAEKGYDLELLAKKQVGRPPRSGVAAQVIPVRLTEDELTAIMNRAKKEHLSRSEAIRTALAEWATSA
ncbi:MAG: CopG family transcriptional regulator [Microbacteriaceae bacterium]|nr:CopG family transcriptional regulator [Microbacteriaceae bacterium]